MAGKLLRWIALAGGLAVSACADDDAERDAPAAGRGGRSGGKPAMRDAGVFRKCADEPQRIYDHRPEIPNGADDADVQVPTIAVGGGSLYALLSWSISGTRSGALVRVPLDGAEPERMLEVEGGGNRAAQGLAVAQSAVVFSRGPSEEAGGPTIVSVPLDGSEPHVLATTRDMPDPPVVAAGSHAYYADAGGTMYVPLKGGEARLLAPSVPRSLGIHGSDLLLADFERGMVLGVPLAGGFVTVHARQQAGAREPLGCGASVCWLAGGVDGAESTLMRHGVGSASELLASGLNEAHSLVFDGESFFVSSSEGGSASLHRVASDGGTPVLIHEAAGLSDLALDAECLYWSSAKGIYSLALPAARERQIDP